MPKTGKLASITALFEAWLTQVPKDNEAYVFPSAKLLGNINWHMPIERGRAHWIIKTTIGKFPHWFRGACETYYEKVVFKNDPFKLSARGARGNKKKGGLRALSQVVAFLACMDTGIS